MNSLFNVLQDSPSLGSKCLDSFVWLVGPIHMNPEARQATKSSSFFIKGSVCFVHNIIVLYLFINIRHQIGITQKWRFTHL